QRRCLGLSERLFGPSRSELLVWDPRRSTAVTELVLLAAPAEAGVVAAGSLLHPDGRLDDLLLLGLGHGGGHAAGRGFSGGGRPQRLGALDRVFGGGVAEPAGRRMRAGLVLDHLEVEDVAHEVVLDE